MLQVMAPNWWMVLVRGSAAILFGIALLLAPVIALFTLVLLWSAYTLVDGILAVISGFRNRAMNRNWWVIVLEGIVSIIAGIGAFLYPGITALVLLYIIAAWALITGVLKIMTAIQLRKEIEGEFWLGLGGLASIVFGLLLILNPGAGILNVLTIVSVYAIVFGIVLIFLAFRLRGFATDLSQPVQSPIA